MTRALARLFWRILPVGLLVWAMRGGAAQYTKYFVMMKNASLYTLTYSNLSQYVTALERHWAEHSALPPDLAAFLRAGFTSKGHDPTLDQWDNPYLLTESESQFTILSCGPDRACRTDDDLASSGVKLSPPTEESGQPAGDEQADQEEP